MDKEKIENIITTTVSIIVALVVFVYYTKQVIDGQLSILSAIFLFILSTYLSIILLSILYIAVTTSEGRIYSGGCLLLLSAIAAITLAANKCDEDKPKENSASSPAFYTTPTSGTYTDPDRAESGYCYICTGSSSYRYHSTPTCPHNCSGMIKEITISHAEEIGYTACQRCH